MKRVVQLIGLIGMTVLGGALVSSFADTSHAQCCPAPAPQCEDPPELCGNAPLKVDICHQRGNSGEFKRISVSETAAESHLENHDDVLPGCENGPLDDECAPTCVTIARSRAR